MFSLLILCGVLWWFLTALYSVILAYAVAGGLFLLGLLAIYLLEHRREAKRLEAIRLRSERHFADVDRSVEDDELETVER